ncbi:MAG: HDOD domain-containing protein [Campylobacterota bacterium]|nr:HDOD domain-containing protein [Campylobacterota bacterium]
METILHIARQPILDKNENIFAYELLYRDASLNANITNDRHATVTVLSNVLNKFGVKNILGKYKAFVKADKKFLMHDVVLCIPKEYFIFALQSDIELSESLEQKITELHNSGYVLAINDTLFTEEILNKFSNILKYISYIKIDINTPKENIEILNNYNIKIIFTKVETYTMYDKAIELNGDYVQGYYFSKPKILKQEKFDPDNIKAINLCNYLMDDSSIEQIVNEFENSHAISLQLLKFVNSGSLKFKNNISSIRQILMTMGKEQLTKWLMLMVYSANDNTGAKIDKSPLMQLMKSRTNLMVEISKQIKDHNIEDFSSKVYLLGVVSLLDTLFNVDSDTILDELNIDSEIKEALNKNDGILSEIYIFAKNLEKFDIKSVEEFCAKYDIKAGSLERLTFEIIQSSNEFENSNVS